MKEYQSLSSYQIGL